MTPDEQTKIDAVERERRRREALLILLLLGVAAQARRYVAHAVADGADVPELRLPTLRRQLRDAMAEAHVAGYRRAGLLAGVRLMPAGVDPTELPLYEVALGQHQAAADQAADDVAKELGRLGRAAVEAVRADAKEAGPRRVGAALALAFQRYGWSPGNPADVDPAATGKAGYAARHQAENAILSAYGAGMWTGFAHPSVGLLITGFRHRSVLDRRTSKICIERGDQVLQLPKGHPYWLANWAPLHPRCRSIVMPLIGEQRWSDWLPTVPPAPGWGKAPAVLFGQRLRPAA